MGLTQLKKNEHQKKKTPNSGKHQQEPRRTVTEVEMCFRTASRKESFEEQPNRAVAENKVLPKAEGRQAAKLGSAEK